MASRSMNYLRKNAKYVMIVMGVILMVTFLIGDAMMNMVGSSDRRGGDNPVVVTWTGGQLRESELADMQMRHQIAVGFLHRVIQMTLERNGSPVVGGQPLRQGEPIQSVGISMDSSEEGIVRTMLLAEEADRMGIVVDHAAVIAFLRQLSDTVVREGDWSEIANDAIGDSRMMTVTDLFDQLAYELKAQHMSLLGQAGLYSVPPGAMWDYFNRLNRRVSVEAFPVESEPFVQQVKDEPTLAELQKLFESGRSRDPNPNLAEPGFHRPQKIAFAWLKADIQPFLEKAKEQITEEQIKERYQQDISQGLHKELELPEDQPADPSGSKPADPTGDKPADPTSEQPQATPPAPTDPAAPAPADAPPSTDAPPASEQPAAPPAQPDAPGEAPEGEAPEDEEEETSEQDESAAAQPPASEQPAAAPTAAEAPAAAQPNAEQPADPAQPPAATQPPADPAQPPATTQPPMDPAQPATEAPPPKEPKFKPLEEVRDQIRETLAQPIAQDQLDKAMESAMDEINEYGKKYRRWQSLKDSKIKTTAADPGPLDLKAIAERHGFEMGTTPLVDRHDVARYEIGQKVAELDMMALQARQFRMLSFAEMAFSAENEPLYRAQKVNSSDPGVSYIYLRTEEQPAADLTFDEAREEVLAAWKRQKAFELALAEAQKLADNAKQAQSLKDVVPDAARVITPPPFSWLTRGSLAMGFGEPELSQVPGVDLAGREFMQAVFSLKPGEAGVAPNQSHTKAYVVRVLAEQPDIETLRTQFLESGLNFETLTVAQREVQQVAFDWFQGLEEQYQVKWLRQPRYPRGMGM